MFKELFIESNQEAKKFAELTKMENIKIKRNKIEFFIPTLKIDGKDVLGFLKEYYGVTNYEMENVFDGKDLLFKNVFKKIEITAEVSKNGVLTIYHPEKIDGMIFDYIRKNLKKFKENKKYKQKFGHHVKMFLDQLKIFDYDSKNYDGLWYVVGLIIDMFEKVFSDFEKALNEYKKQQYIKSWTVKR